MNKNFIEILKLYKPNTLYWYNRIKLFLIPYIKVEKLVPKNGFIIDLGCSHGLFTNLLGFSSEKREVLGLEINQDRIKYANIGIKNTKFITGDITKVDIPQADCIIFTHVLQATNNQRKKMALDDNSAYFSNVRTSFIKTILFYFYYFRFYTYIQKSYLF